MNALKEIMKHERKLVCYMFFNYTSLFFKTSILVILFIWKKIFFSSCRKIMTLIEHKSDDDLQIFASNIREFCDNSFLKYSKIRSNLKISLDSFPAYELAKFYYEIASLWFECCDAKYVALNICKDYLKKCLDIFDNSTVDIALNAKILLNRVIELIKEKTSEIKTVEDLLKKSNSKNDKELLGKNVLLISKNYIAIGNLKRAYEYLIYLNQMVGDDDFISLKFVKQFTELTVSLNGAEKIKAHLDLQESLMFMDHEDHTEVEFGFKENEIELKESLKVWKRHCNELKKNKNRCKLRFLSEEDENKISKDTVYKGSEIFIYSNNKSQKYKIGCINMNTNKFDKIEIKDKILLEMLANRKFSNSITNNLIERVNIVLNKIGSAYYLSKITKNKILILANKKEVTFYLYLCLTNTNNQKTTLTFVGDMVYPSKKNHQTLQLWSLLFKIFNGEITISETEFLQKLINEYQKTFYGLLLRKLPLLNNEKFENVYQNLSLVYLMLGNKPLANHYFNMSRPTKQAKNDITSAKNELLKQSIVSNSGLALPGDNFLNEPISESDLFTILLPRLNKIESLQKCQHPCVQLTALCSDVVPVETKNWFDSAVFGEYYKKEQIEAVQNYGKLLNVCFLIYFTQTNTWGIMLKLNNSDVKLQGMLSDFKKYEKNDLKNVSCLLMNIKRQVDFKEEEKNEINNSLRKIFPITQKLAYSLTKIEFEINLFLQKNFINKNKIYDDLILFNENVAQNEQNIYDLTSIDGIIQLKTAVKDAREGYYVLIRKADTYDDLYSSQFKETVQITQFNGNYFIYGKTSDEKWTVKEIDFSGKIDLMIPLEVIFKKLQPGANNKKFFVSPMQNALLFHLIKDSIGDNLNLTTKSLAEDAFYAILKVSKNQYAAMAIVKANYTDPLEYTIFLADPSNSMINYVDFLEVTSKNFRYRFRPEFSFIMCPNEKTITDTLVKAYFIYKTMQFAWRKGKENWLFFCVYFRFQMICNTENIQTVKKWLLNADKVIQIESEKSNQMSQIKDISYEMCDDISTILNELDEKFECTYNESDDDINENNTNVSNDLINLLDKCKQSTQLVNRVQNYQLENVIAHNLIKEIQNNFDNVDNLILLETLKSTILKKKTVVAGEVLLKLINEIELAIKADNEENLDLTNLRAYLTKSIYEEKFEIITQVVGKCQLEINTMIKNSFTQLLNESLTNKQEFTENLKEVKTFLQANQFTGFESFLKLATRLNCDSNLQNLCEIWLKSEEIFKFDKNEKHIVKFLINNFKCITRKITLFCSLLEPFKTFLKSFIDSVLKEYGKQDLQDLYKLIYHDIETKLINDEDFFKLMPANAEVNRIMEKAKFYSKLNSIKFSNNDDCSSESIVICKFENNFKVMLKNSHTNEYSNFQVLNENMCKLLSKYQNNLNEVNFDEITIAELLKSFENDLKLNFDALIVQHEDQASSFILKIGENILKSSAVWLCRRLPKYISNYRQSTTVLFERFYEILHESFIKDLEVLDAKFEFIFCSELPHDLDASQNRQIYVKLLEQQDLVSNFEVAFYSTKEKRLINGKKFTSNTIFGLSGVINFEEKTENEIICSIEYYNYNEPLESFILKCDKLICDYKNRGVECINSIIRILNNDEIKPLVDFTNDMLNDKCGTKRYFEEYYTMIESLIKSFSKVFGVLKAIKQDLWQTLTNRFEMVPDSMLAETLKTEILDKISAETDINEILSCFDNELKFQNEDRIQTTLNDLKDSFENRNDLKGKYACCSLIKQFIINLVEKYIESLLRYREKLNESMNLIEKILSEVLSSYYLVSSRSVYKKQIEEQFNKFSSDGTSHQESAKAYSETLNLISNWPKQIVNLAQRKNLEDFIAQSTNSIVNLKLLKFENRIKNMRKLLDNFINAHDIDIDEDQTEDRIVVTAKVKSSVLSDIIRDIYRCMPRKFQPGDELRIISSDKVYIDQDLDEKIFSGVNIVLIGLEFDLAPGQISFTIKTNGIDAIEHYDKKAINGQNGLRSGLDGCDGEDGLNGLPGGHSGNIYIFASKVPDPSLITLTACGGKGSDAQLGGDGGNGADGVDGKSRTKTECKRILYYSVIDDFTTSWKVNYFSGVSWALGSPGQEGGAGGNSGYSGFGGDCGDAGSISVKCIDSNSLNKKQIQGAKGKDGNWEETKPGTCGKHGRDGITMIMTADVIRLKQIDCEKDELEENMHFVSCRCYNVDLIKKNTGYRTDTPKDRSNNDGFVYRSKAGTYHTASWCKPYVNGVNLDENDARLNNKYASTSRNGQKKKNKNKNAQIAKKINSINTFDIYNECKKFFGKLCQSESDSYQSWKADKISNFLNKFANLLNTSDSYGINTKVVSNTRQQISNLFNSSLQRLKEEEIVLSKSRSAETLKLGLTQFSQSIAQELEQINKNEKLWKQIQEVQVKKEREILVSNKSSKKIEEKLNDVDNLRVLKNHVEIENKIKFEITIAERIEPLNVKEIINPLGIQNIEQIDKTLNRLKNESCSFKETTFQYINSYKIEDFIQSLKTIKHDKNFLNNYNYILTDDTVSILYAYIETVSLRERLEKFLSNKINNDEVNTTVKMICDGLKSPNETDPHLLVHKVLLIDCIEALTNGLAQLKSVNSNEIKRIINWMNAYYNISSCLKSIRGFNGTLLNLGKRILQFLFKDTVENCFPSLLNCMKEECMNNINIDLLSIFYNKLQYEYHNSNVRLLSKKDDLPSYICIKSEDFMNIFVSLNDVTLNEQTIADYDVKKTLSRENLSAWSNIISEIKLSILFTNLLKNSSIKLDARRIRECLRLLNSFRQQWTNEKFENFIGSDDQLEQPPDSTDPLHPFYKLLLSLQNNKITFDDALEIKKCNYSEWLGKIKKAESKALTYTETKQRSIEEIVVALKEQNIDSRSLSTSFLSEVKQNLLKIDDLINAKKQQADIKPTEQRELLKTWLENAKNDMNNLCEIISILAIAWYIENKQIPKQTQLAALLLFINSNLQKESLLEQINTGEGKTLSVGLTSAYLALNGLLVDVVSSNRDLAIDGEKKCSSFFSLLGLTSNHNCHTEDEDLKKAYKCNIVYGEVSAFQGNILDTQFNKNDICGTRYDDMKKVCLVVDEVDSMCLDKAKDVLYLSHNIEALKWLENVFVFIWLSVLKENPNDEEELKKKVQEVSEAILQGIKNKNLLVPEYLIDYVKAKVKIWTDHAFQAKAMEANDEFVIDKSNDGKNNNKEGKQKKIIVLDKDVGIEQYSSRWSNGLAQFLELKYRRKLSVESLKAVFMSNKKYFELYGRQLYGLTGTLGSSISRTFLKEIYKTNFIIIPTSYPKKYYMETPKIATNAKDWLNSVIESVKEHNNRPVLIITDTVQSAELIMSQLKTEGISQNKIRSYTRDFDEVEKHFHANPASSGDVIVATNKGGRGTDIKISDVNNREHGGLHVILTYLPSNDRIEDQAFGRTSRNGNPGSGEFILLIEENFDEELTQELANLDQEERAIRLDEMAPAILQKKKDERNKTAELFLDDLMKTGILHLDMEQNLFDKFKVISGIVCNNIQSVVDDYIAKLNDKKRKKSPAYISWYGEEHIARHGLLQEALDAIGGYSRFRKFGWDEFYEEIKINLVDAVFKRDIEEFILNAVKDYWAFWLDSVQSEINESKSFNVQEKLLSKMDSDFADIINISKSSIHEITDLLKLTKYPEQQVRLGQIFLRHGQMDLAEKCFEYAKEYDILGVAYIGLAYSKIPPIGDHDDDEEFVLKKEVRRLLKKASCKIEVMKRILQTNNLIGSKLSEMTKDVSSISQFISPEDNFYCNQVENKLKVLETHLRLIGKAIGSSFQNEYVFAEGNEKEFEKSKNIYFKFVNANIIHHNRVRREYVNKATSKLNDNCMNLIKANFDKTIYEPLIDLLNTNINENHINVEKFQSIARDKNEFWDILKKCAPTYETVQILSYDKAVKELPVEYQTIFEELTGKYEVRVMELDELPNLKQAYEVFGDVLTLIRLTDNSIHFYHKSFNGEWCFTQLVDKWSIEKCEKLPSNQSVFNTRNILYFTSNETAFEYAYFSQSNTRVILGGFNKEESKKLLEVLSQDNVEKAKLLLGYIIGQEEALFQIPFNYNATFQISPNSNEQIPNIIYSAILKHPKIPLKFMDIYNVSSSLFDTEKKSELKKLWEKEELLTTQERLVVKNNQNFLNMLKRELDTVEPRIRNKYKDIAYKDYKQDGLIYFLKDCFDDKLKYAEDSIRDYFYISEIPFNMKQIETETVIKILHDLKILKSGGLALRYNGGNINESKYAYKEFKGYIEKIKPYDCNAYIDNVVSLQGEIRSYRDGLKGWLQHFAALELGGSETEVPEELDFYSPLGFHRALVLEENKKFRMNWAALAVFILGVAQIVGGCILCACGLPNIGNALISEGVSDLVQGMMGMITGQFSLADWAQSKLISLAISLLTAGLQALNNASKVAGTLTKMQKFAKAVAKACTDIVLQVGCEMISKYGIGDLMAYMNDAITKSLKPKIKESLNIEAIKVKLKQLRKEKGNMAYKEALAEMKKSMSTILADDEIKGALNKIQKFQSIVKSIKDAMKKQQAPGDWKKQLAKAAADQGMQFLITQGINLLKTAEIPLIMHQVNNATKKNMEEIEKKLTSEGDCSQELTKEQENQIDEELNRFCEQISGRISSDICEFISGIANGALRIGFSLAKIAINDKIDQKLTRKFEKKNERIARDKGFQRERVKDRNKATTTTKQTAAQKAEQQKVNEKIENEEFNPKKSIDDNMQEKETAKTKKYESEVKDRSREMNLADAQLQANKDGRKIEVRDFLTGKIITLEPESLWGKCKAMFKETAVIDFGLNRAGGGHYVTGSGVQQKPSSDNNCMLAGYYASLDENNESIQQRRNSLANYIEKHPDEYVALRKEFAQRGFSHVQGGADPPLPSNQVPAQHQVPAQNQVPAPNSGIYIPERCFACDDTNQTIDSTQHAPQNGYNENDPDLVRFTDGLQYTARERLPNTRMMLGGAIITDVNGVQSYAYGASTNAYLTGAIDQLSPDIVRRYTQKMYDDMNHQNLLTPQGAAFIQNFNQSDILPQNQSIYTNFTHHVNPTDPGASRQIPTIFGNSVRVPDGLVDNFASSLVNPNGTVRICAHSSIDTSISMARIDVNQYNIREVGFNLPNYPPTTAARSCPTCKEFINGPTSHKPP